jgi:hypothetical protein
LKLIAKWIVLRSKMSLHIPRLAPGLWIWVEHDDDVEPQEM